LERGIMDRAVSQGGVPIRLTEERWFHIVENHDDLAGHYDDVLDTVENPDMIATGYGGALIAVKAWQRRRYLAVVYRELSRDDGFIITAYFTSRPPRRSIRWRREQQRRRL
jgi:hypothetical protein